MVYRPLLRLAIIALPLTLGGCGMFDWATNNMPVIGQRCENWQCFTASGQAQSQTVAEQRKRPAENPLSAPVLSTPADSNALPAAKPPADVAVPLAATTEPLAPPMPEGGAYKYVPRGPAAPGTTPFDGPIQ